MKGCLWCVLSSIAGGLDLEWMLTPWKTGHPLPWPAIVLLVGCLIVFWTGCAKAGAWRQATDWPQVKSHMWVEGDHDDS